ncbi:MAG: barstar family protein [Sphingomonadales bacterium]|nr:barstar family protein [Sphingomonadales bacterium]
MRTKVIEIPTSGIVDWDTFHDVFDATLGFPQFYGRNMNAWIDCLSNADDANSGLVANPVSSGDLLTLSIIDAAEFKQRCPDQFETLIECAAFVNYRRRVVGDGPILALLIDGNFS